MQGAISDNLMIRRRPGCRSRRASASLDSRVKGAGDGSGTAAIQNEENITLRREFFYKIKSWDLWLAFLVCTNFVCGMKNFAATNVALPIYGIAASWSRVILGSLICGFN